MFKQSPLVILLWCLASMTELSMIMAAGICILVLGYAFAFAFAFAFVVVVVFVFERISSFAFTLCSRKVVGVSEILLHPNYNPADNPNDLALLKLAEKVDLLRFMRPSL